MAVELDLQDNEVVEKEVKGDYWQKLFLIAYDQIRGKYWFTNQRILFKGGLLGTALDLPYAEIASVETCWVGGLIPIIPTGVRIKMKDGQNYKLSVMKRNGIIDMIQARL